MKISGAIYLAQDMIKRAEAGDSGIGILSAMGGPFYKPNLTKVKKSTSDFTRRIPEEPKYKGVLETLIENEDEPGVKETLQELYEQYPELKKSSVVL